MFFSSMLTTMATLQEPTNQTSGTPAWVIILILLIIILLFWWGLTRNNIPEETAVDDHATDHAEDTHEAVSRAEVPESETAVVSPDPDDLKKIEGIGPKISSILTASGITTFDQLANTSLDDLDRIVRQEAGITIANPTSWPAQAKLAAADDWDALAELQDKLVAGRHQ